MASSERSVAEGSKLKSAQLLDLVKAHLATDAGKDLQQKIGYTYQINIAPKVALSLSPVSLYLFSLSFLSVLFAFLLNFRNLCWEQKRGRGFTGNHR
jgi:hypothetical protein